VPGFENYVSWSPADVFERTYKPCGTFVERLVAEEQELRERLDKLEAFMRTAKFKTEIEPAEQFWMTAQRNAMSEYRAALAKRIAMHVSVPESVA
jgi:hypothetical protein